MTALNPVMTCGAQPDELLSEQHSAQRCRASHQNTLAMLEAVKLQTERIFASYPPSSRAGSGSAS